MADKVDGLWIGGWAVMLALSGCEQGTEALIDVRSNSDILFSIPEKEAQHYCINSVEVRRYVGGTQSMNYEVSWRIKLKPGQSGPCDSQINYPKTPATFVTEVNSEQLTAGEYVVVIDGGIGTASGEFTIPASPRNKSEK